MAIELPPGAWVTLRGQSYDTTAAEVQKLFMDRTGVEIPLERISVVEGQATIIVSLMREHVAEILQWAFQEDSLRGRVLRITGFGSKREK